MMGLSANIDAVSVVKNLVMVLLLLVVILFVVTWAGVVKCSAIPFWCDGYEFVMGSPRVLIVHNSDALDDFSGLGNPVLLEQYLKDPRIVGAESVAIQDVDNLSLGNLKNYKLVIVEQARQLSYEQLLMFMDYVNQGGRLVWIGDSGVVKGVDEVQNLADINGLATLDDNPWVRVEKTGENMINFDEFLSLRYIDNYCNEKDCVETLFPLGLPVPEPTRNHPLIFGSAWTKNLYISKGRDLAIVRQIPNSPNSNIVMTIDFGGKLTGKENDLGTSTPFIVTSGLGERIAYYAYPLEYLVQDNNSYHLIRNMYYGMLGK